MVRAPSNARRSGFTLTEMLVASALIIFMMWILSSAFEKGLTTFSQLKNAGDMQEKLRAAATVIRQDLISPHFDEGPEFVSGQRLDQTDWKPPAQGFFRIYQEGASLDDGRDPDDSSGTLIHKRSPGTINSRGHVMQFTVKQKADRRDRYFLVDPQDSNSTTDGPLHALSFPTYNIRRRAYYKIPSNPIGQEPEYPSSVFTTNWAEITYFVQANQGTTGNIPLYSLYRRQNLLVNDTGNTAAINAVSLPANSDVKASRYVEVSALRPSASVPGQLNSQKTITAPSRRFAVQPGSRAGAFQSAMPRLQDEPSLALLAGDRAGQAAVGSDLLLTDITDFEIKVMWDPAPASGTIPAAPTPQPANNPDFPFAQLPAGNNPSFASANVFDTWSRNASSGTSLDEYRENVNPTAGGPAVEAWNGGYASSTSFSERSIPVKIRVRAIQIELRIWDIKSKQSRQITIIQDL